MTNMDNVSEPETTKKRVPETLLLPGLTLEKKGGLLLSHIALQYHRRKRA